MGGYLVALYLVSKLFYIANVVSQLFVLNTVLGMTYSTFGIDMIKYATLRYALSLLLAAHDQTLQFDRCISVGILVCLQCFDTVGRALGRASGL